MEKIESKLRNIKNKELYRDFNYIQSSQSNTVFINNKKVLLLGSNNYLDLSDNIILKKHCKKIIDSYGLGAGGSRLTTGTYDLNKDLEDSLSQLKKTESALVFSTGYMANVGVISSLCDRNWVIFSDKLNHASIVDGCILSGAKLVRYNHLDMDDLIKKIHTHKGKNNLIVTDGVFSMDGHIAPLDEIALIGAKHNIITMVDDAHGFGVLGKKGSGVVSHFNLEDKIDIQVGTLSKAIPSIGGYVCSKKHIIDYIKNSARSFIYSTGLPPAHIATSLGAIEYMKTLDSTRKHLLEMSLWLKKKLIELGYEVTNTQTPIIPIIIGDARKCHQLSNALLEDGIYVNSIRPPTVPKKTSRLRVSLMASHTYEQLNFFINRLNYHYKNII